MPASLGTEEALIKLLIAKGEWVATKSYLAMAKIAAPTKITTEKEFEENEITEANGWKRQELDALEYEVTTKGEGATGFTIIKNKNAITLVSAAKEIKSELKLESFAVKKEALQANDKANTTNVFLFGKLTTPVTLNEATSKFEIPAKEFIVECE
jgi:hypothetical protein